MGALDKVIGYDDVKHELRMIADTLKNREKYGRLGVSMPRGLLLHGEPGVGKSLMAQCLIEESDLESFTCRKTESSGKFLKTIRTAFERAAESAPAVVLLDDLDKFANSDERLRDAEEYVTVQACIDELKGKDVFVIATANDIDRLPDSLLRAGRFDRVIEVGVPKGADATKIIEHYLRSKKLSSSLDPAAIAAILEGRSCAVLETVLNEAGIIAGFEGKASIAMRHVVAASMKLVHGVDVVQLGKPVDLSVPTLESMVVWHEAGHAVVAEVLCPGSVVMASVSSGLSGEQGVVFNSYNGRAEGLRRAEIEILVLLAGKAAVEGRFGLVDEGCGEDLLSAASLLRKLFSKLGYGGLGFVSGFRATEERTARVEAAVDATMEICYHKTREILDANRPLFERFAEALAKKGVLFAEDIAEMRTACGARYTGFGQILAERDVR